MLPVYYCGMFNFGEVHFYSHTLIFRMLTVYE